MREETGLQRDRGEKGFHCKFRVLREYGQRLLQVSTVDVNREVSDAFWHLELPTCLF